MKGIGMKKSVLAAFGDGEPFIYGETIYFKTVLDQEIDGLQFYAHSLFVCRDDKFINITSDYSKAVNHGIPCGEKYVTNNKDALKLIQKLGDQAFLDFNAFVSKNLDE
jgi:hypothetical protein